ncbi:eukaryotic translation initiation factor 5A-3-like isoform X2 [Apium graveolens]
MVDTGDLWGYETIQECPPNTGFMPEKRTVVRKVRDLRSFVCIKEHPCKIVAIRTPIDPATRKYHRVKRQFVVIDIFTGEVFKATFPLSGTCDVPIVTLTDYRLVVIREKDSHMTLLDEKGNIRQDLKLPTDQDLLSKVKFGLSEGKAVFLSVASAMGKEKIIASKILKPKY